MQEQRSFCGDCNNRGLRKKLRGRGAMGALGAWKNGSVERRPWRNESVGPGREGLGREDWGERGAVEEVRGAPFVKGPRKAFQNDITPPQRAPLQREAPLLGGQGRTPVGKLCGTLRGTGLLAYLGSLFLARQTSRWWQGVHGAAHKGDGASSCGASILFWY